MTTTSTMTPEEARLRLRWAEARNGGRRLSGHEVDRIAFLIAHGRFGSRPAPRPTGAPPRRATESPGGRDRPRRSEPQIDGRRLEYAAVLW